MKNIKPLTFKQWWDSGIHGWDPKEKLSEYKLAKHAWNAAIRSAREVLGG